jgi:deazaflavin-dependent oxidoreductase (nitroreductase family)
MARRPSFTRERHDHERRSWLGLRRAPGRLALAIFRAPVWLFHHGHAAALGRTFLLLEHVGRSTGRPHETVAMVLADDPCTGDVVICSAWGTRADWLCNICAGPAKEVRIGRDRFVPEHRVLTEGEAFVVATAFRDRHPRRLRLMSAVLGWGDLRSDGEMRAFVRWHPFVAFRPSTGRHALGRG